MLATLVYLYKHDPEFVGYITAVMGMMQLAASVPRNLVSRHGHLARQMLVGECAKIFLFSPRRVGLAILIIIQHSYSVILVAHLLCLSGISSTS